MVAGTRRTELDANVARLLATLESGLERRQGQDPTVEAIHELGDLGSQEARPALRRALLHPSVPVKVSAASALVRLGDDMGLEALGRFLGEHDATVAAGRALAEIGSARARALLEHAKSLGGERMFNGCTRPMSEIIDVLLRG
jgi:HEAT repeat protein